MKRFLEEDDVKREDEIEPLENKRRIAPRWKRQKDKLKEPIKPWGKKERYLVLTIFLATSLIPAFLALSARAYKLPGLPELSPPKASFIKRFFEGKTIVLEKEENEIKEDEAMNKKKEIIVSRFKGETNKLSGVYGLYIVDLKSGFSFGVNESETFDAASLIKLPVMAAMYRMSEDGEIDLNEKYSLKNSDKASGAGSLFYKPAGYLVSYGEILNLMGQQSDNTAFVIARNKVGKENIENLIRKIGMVDTRFDTRQTTPRDIGIFFFKLWQGKVVNQSNRDKILDSLTKTIFEDYLPAGLPENVRIAHKFGTLENIINDAGIVFDTNHPYVIVLMSKGIIEREAKLVVPAISKMVFEEMGKD
jgi:beta-lactamase class A